MKIKKLIELLNELDKKDGNIVLVDDDGCEYVINSIDRFDNDIVVWMGGKENN